MGDNVNSVIRKLGDAVYNNGTQLLNSRQGPYSGEDNKFLALPGADQFKLQEFNQGLSPLSNDDAYEVFLGSRDEVLATIKAAGCKLV